LLQRNKGRQRYLEVSIPTAFKRRSKTAAELDGPFQRETEYSILWADREVTKEALPEINEKVVKEIADRHSQCKTRPCCGALEDLKELGILDEYIEHMKKAREALERTTK
jgi:hypothetical protein